MSTELAHREQDQAPVATVNNSAAIIQVIERAAMNPDVDLDKMERLLQMQERILDRDAKAAFSSALAMMQSELPSISEKGEISVNGTVRSRYARFEDINDTVRPVLQRFGFAVTFRVKQEGVQITVTGILAHSAGYSEETSIMLPADTSGSKNAVQAVGSTVSYGKRYTMCALLNITSRGEDDDGNGGKGIAPEYITDQQAKQLIVEAAKAGLDVAYICKKARVNSLEEIHAVRFQAAMNHLKLLNVPEKNS